MYGTELLNDDCDMENISRSLCTRTDYFQVRLCQIFGAWLIRKIDDGVDTCVFCEDWFGLEALIPEMEAVKIRWE
jgi:hypothetical protein